MWDLQFYVHHNLTVGFLSHCSQYSHYFSDNSAAIYCQFTVLIWPTLPTAYWRGEVKAEIYEPTK